MDETQNLSIGSLADVGVAFAPTIIDGDKLVLVYPESQSGAHDAHTDQRVTMQCSQCFVI